MWYYERIFLAILKHLSSSYPSPEAREKMRSPPMTDKDVDFSSGAFAPSRHGVLFNINATRWYRRPHSAETSPSNFAVLVVQAPTTLFSANAL